MFEWLPISAIVIGFLVGGADDPEPPGEERLAAVSRRGMLLAEYDRAAWHASDALRAIEPKDDRVGQYIARKGADGWVVSFGRPTPEGDAFLVAYEAVSTKTPDSFEAKAIEPPRRETGFELAASRAIATALGDFIERLEVKRPYNVAVLPAEGDDLWVYFLPAPTRAGVWPLGADVRYRVSPDGTQIRERRPMHRTVIEIEPPAADGDQLAAGMHTHVLEAVPEDSDVFHVLTRKPSVPEIIVTEHFVFQVAPDGAIAYVGRTGEVLKDRSKAAPPPAEPAPPDKPGE